MPHVNSKIQDRQFMHACWQVMFDHSQRMFRAMHMGHIKQFKKEARVMSEMLKERCADRPMAIEPNTASGTCQYCRHANRNGIRLICNGQGSPSRWMVVGAGGTCTEFER